MNERVLWFPNDVEVGSYSASIGDREVARGPARGWVRVPEEADVHLWLACPVRGLGSLRPDDVQTIKLQKKAATDADLARLSHLTGLRELDASKSHAVTDAGVAALAPLRRLRALDLYWSAVTDDGLRHLVGMVELEDLHLGLTHVAGPGLACLAGLQRLAVLRLEDTDVGDAAVPFLLRLRALRTLTLRETRMSTRGIAELWAGLPLLREAWMNRPGHRLARERARTALLAILAGRLDPASPEGVAPEETLRALLPAGSRVTEIRRGGPVLPTRMGLDRLDSAVFGLAALGTGFDLHIVSPDGLDVWVPWLRARRRRDRRRGNGVAARHVSMSTVTGGNA
jgi:hypothetical protein